MEKKYVYIILLDCIDHETIIKVVDTYEKADEFIQNQENPMFNWCKYEIE